MPVQKPSYHVTPVTDLRLWDEMLQKIPGATAFHSSTWSALLADHFPQLRFVPLGILQDTQLMGAFPCYLFRPIPLIHMLYSSHWNLPGGPLFHDGSDIDQAELTQQVRHSLTQLAQKHHLSEIQLNTSPLGNTLCERSLMQAGFEKHVKRFTHLLDICQGRNAVWEAYNKRVRGAVRKAEKNGVTVSITEDEDTMRQFYGMYLSMMRHFGSPPKPYGLLRALQVSSIGRLAVAMYQGRLIGGLLFLPFAQTVTLWVEATLPEHLHLRTNNALIDFIVAWACERGYSWVDFGASPPEREGLVDFKEEWRARQHDFMTYRWVRSPLRYRLWEMLEPPLRRAYGRLQQKSAGPPEP